MPYFFRVLSKSTFNFICLCVCIMYLRGVGAMILCMYVFNMLSLESRCLKVMLSEWCCRWGLFGMTVLLQHCFSLGCGFL